MANVPAARFEGRATEGGSNGIRRRVGDFVAACGVESADRAQIAHTLGAALDVASGHARSRDDVLVSVIADVMPSDVQLVLRLCAEGQAFEDAEAVGGFELWISFRRD